VRTRIAVLAVLAAGTIGAPPALARQVHATCGAGYVSAQLPWGHKCLRAGEFCKVGDAAYLRYGFTCP
jgi:hypothetical protein